MQSIADAPPAAVCKAVKEGRISLIDGKIDPVRLLEDEGQLVRIDQVRAQLAARLARVTSCA